MFDKATRLKLRFKIGNGILLTEDLWDLTFDKLDILAKSLNRELKDSQESFIEDASSQNARTQLAFDVVKHVITIKLAERKARQDEQKRYERRQELLRILNEKDIESLKAKSREEILKELESLEISE